MVKISRALSRITVVAVLLVAGCSSDDDDGAGTAPAGATTTTTAAAPADEGTDPLPPLPDDVALPIVFVHGFAGSGQQFESQAMRFVANGYPAERIVDYDHDGAGMDIAGYADGLDEVIDATIEEFAVEQVYLVGHSRGTSVSNDYLSDDGRAAKVAKYVAIDGRPCPDVVPCAAPTQAEFPGQAHVEVATSPESFAMQYEFLVGEAPEVVDIVPQTGPVEVSGRAVVFPANTGRESTLEIWAIDADTGMRTDEEPHATFEVGEDGEFGPVELENGAHYEYVLSDDSSPTEHHIYPQPYVRDSHLMRLLSSTADGDTRVNTNQDPAHVSLIAMRMREWYADDHEGTEADDRDVLTITAEGIEPAEVIDGFEGNGSIAVHVHDDEASPGETTLGPLPYFSTQPFQKGVDVYLPASEDGSGTITVTNLPRGDADRPQVLNVPDWPSDGHAISVMFSDYPVDGATEG